MLFRSPEKDVLQTDIRTIFNITVTDTVVVIRVIDSGAWNGSSRVCHQDVYKRQAMTSRVCSIAVCLRMKCTILPWVREPRLSMQVLEARLWQDVYKRQLSHSAPLHPDCNGSRPDSKAPNVTVSSFTLPFPTEDVVFNPNLMKDPVHVDVRSEFSY